MYQILSESTGFCGRYDKNIVVCCFSVRSIERATIIKDSNTDAFIIVELLYITPISRVQSYASYKISLTFEIFTWFLCVMLSFFSFYPFACVLFLVCHVLFAACAFTDSVRGLLVLLLSINN